jgi:hypothetical protein
MRAAILAVGVLGLAAAGCGGPSSATVSGQVTVDGQPLEKGYITFTPAGGKGGSVMVNVENGRYTATTTTGPNVVQISAPVVIDRKTIPAGDKTETVEITEEGLPEKYNVGTELKLDVTGSMTKDWPVEWKPVVKAKKK